MTDVLIVGGRWAAAKTYAARLMGDAKARGEIVRAYHRSGRFEIGNTRYRFCGPEAEHLCGVKSAKVIVVLPGLVPSATWSMIYAISRTPEEIWI